jgi:hypothetical protein
MTSFSAVHTLKPLEEEESEREDEEEKIKKDANDRVTIIHWIHSFIRKRC